MHLARAAIHTITNRPWTLEQCVRAYEGAGLGGISVWPESLAEMSIRDAARLLEASPLEVVALVRGGFFVHPGRGGAARSHRAQPPAH